MGSNTLHMHNVAVLSRTLGERYNLTEDDLDLLETAGGLHDIGKKYISEEILLADRKLTVFEFKIVERHAEYGADYLIKCGYDERIVEAVRHHHEWWNGKGYPTGLKGNEIPLFSRIISIADAYDAMTSERSYKKAISPVLAINEIKKCAGSQFDPQLVNIFMSDKKMDLLLCIS